MSAQRSRVTSILVTLSTLLLTLGLLTLPGGVRADPSPSTAASPAQATDPTSLYLPMLAAIPVPRLAFVAGPADNLDVFTVNIDRTNLTQPATEPGILGDGGVGWSPDGTRIAYMTSDGIAIRRADGTDKQTLSATAGLGTYPITWSPDGTRIAFGGFCPAQRIVCIYLINADGTGLTRLSPTDFTLAVDPAWSPDGASIAFSGGKNQQAIFVIKADGSGLRQLAVEGNQPAWSPDGSRIAFTALRSPSIYSQVYVMNSDGTAERQVAQEMMYSSGPAWSPDGKRLAFGGRGNAVTYAAIYTVNVDGTGQIQLTDKLNTYRPHWSPKGDWIAYQVGGDGVSELWAMRADGSEKRRLADQVYFRSTAGSIAWQPR